MMNWRGTWGLTIGLAGLASALPASPAMANPNTEWQEKHKDLAFLAGRWLGRVYGDEFVIEGDRLILAKKRTEQHAHKPIGFALVTNLRLKEVQRANSSTVYFEFTGTCHSMASNGRTSSYPAPSISVSVSSSITGGLLTGNSSIGSSCFGNIDRPPVLLPVAEANNRANLVVADDDPAVDREVLDLIKGNWVSRHESDDSEVTISGREVRLVKTRMTRNDRLGVPAPGTVVGVIDAIKPWGQRKSPITGQMVKHYVVMARSLTTNGQAWVMSSWPSIGYLRDYTFEKEDRPYGRRVPMLDYRSLTGSGSFFSDMWRPADKARIFGKAPIAAPPRPPRTPPTRTQPAAPPVPPRSATTPSTPPNTPPRPHGGPAAAAAQPPAPPVTVPATSEQEQRELAERERLNQQQADFAKQQLQQNAANQRAYEQAERDRAATIARQKAEYDAAVAATEAERLRREREHAEAMARWQADVEACKKGDKTRCAPQ